MKDERTMFVTVVLCAYNGRKTIRDCLEGLFAQTYSSLKYEVLIVDDESTDNTFDIVANFVGAQESNSVHMQLSRIQHGGLSVARNAGIQLSKGEIIAFIDQDAVPESTWLEELVKPFEKEADYVGGRINLLNTESWVARFLQITIRRQFFGPKFLNSLIGCNMAFHRRVFEVAGGFHENFTARSDETTLVKRIQSQFRYLPAPNAIVFHEQPETIPIIIKAEWKYATLMRLVSKVVEEKRSFRGMLSLISQFFISFFPVFLALALFWPIYFAVPLAISSLALVRPVFFGYFVRQSFLGLVKCYGPVLGFIGHICCTYIFNAVHFVGAIVGYWIHRKATIIPPMTRELIVLKELGNR